MSQINKKAVILMAVVATLVAAGGLTAYFMTRDNGVAAIVNGTKISTEKVETEMVKALTQYETQGMALPPEQMAEMRASIIDNMIIREVLLQESISYEISPEELDEQISSFKKRFDSEEAFTEALELQGFNMESFLKVISEDMRIQKMISERVPEETVVSDEEIQTFYNENPTYFTEPERVHASHILVSLEDKTTEQEKSTALKKIERIERELKNGADFAELAKLESEGPSGPKGGDLGEFPRGQMIPAFEEVAFSLAEGKISGIVETQFGYHIIKLHSKFPESAVPLEDVKESINSYLLQEKSQSKMTDFLEELKEDAKIRIPEYKQSSIPQEEIIVEET